ncbi:MAG: glycosyltransferase [Ruminococcus sp.]|nr:glycosyltransferase [Ruminococcus sp.]
MDKETKLPAYSVAMSVYAGEKPEFLRQSLESMLTQTHPCTELLLVCDGRLTDGLDAVIAEYLGKFGGRLSTVRMGKPAGVGACANEALNAARTEYIVKMDSDDIADPRRCEVQLRYMSRHPELDMCGAYIEEFDSATGRQIAIKRTPVKNHDIHRYARRRNPFNNQTLVYRKSAAKRIGGYGDFRRCEDYEFVVRMLKNGAIGVNIPRVLVRYRVTEDNLSRRRNLRNTKSFIAVRWRIFRMGYSSLIDFLVPCAAQIALFLLPGSLTGWLYGRFLRK